MKVNAISCSTDKEIFQDELAICRRERSLANRAMYQSTRQVGVSFYAHDLVGRPAAGANKLSRMVLSHCPTPSSDPTEPVEKIHPQMGYLLSRQARSVPRMATAGPVMVVPVRSAPD